MKLRDRIFYYIAYTVVGKPTTISKEEVGDTCVGFHMGLRLAKHHPEYAVALGEAVERDYIQAIRKGEAQMDVPEDAVTSIADRAAQEMPEACPLKGRSDNGHEDL